jgi:tetratricopeptide (TPR) repeat protein
MLGYWFAHGSVDWLWQFPALTGPAFAVVACVASVDSRDRPGPRLPGRRIIGGVAGVVAAAVLIPPWLAARQTSLGAQVWRTKPAQAYSDLDAAARLNRLSDQAYVIAGTIAERRRDWRRVERYFSRALDRNGSNWYSHLERGVAFAKTGRRAAALAELSEAKRLDPREPIIRIVLRDVVAGRGVAVAALDSAMLRRTEVPRGR